MAGPRKELTQDRILDMSIPEPNSGCWLWLRTVNKAGYGYIKSGGKLFLAHRASYTVFKGDIEDEVVMHLCNNPSCVNPDHLVAGNQSANIKQMHRQSRGHSNNYNHRDHSGRFARS